MQLYYGLYFSGQFWNIITTFLRDYWTCTLRTRIKRSLNYIQHAFFFQTVPNNICFLSHRTAIHSECAFSRWYPFCLPTHYLKLPQTVYLLIVTIIFFCQVWREVLSEDNVHNFIKSHLFILHYYAATNESVCVARVYGLWIDLVHIHTLSSCPLYRMAGRALERPSVRNIGVSLKTPSENLLYWYANRHVNSVGNYKDLGVLFHVSLWSGKTRKLLAY